VALCFERSNGVTGKYLHRRMRTFQGTAISLGILREEDSSTASPVKAARTSKHGKHSVEMWPCSCCENNFAEFDTTFTLCDWCDFMVCEGPTCHDALAEHERSCEAARGFHENGDGDHDDDDGENKCNRGARSLVPIQIGEDANMKAMERISERAARRTKKAADKTCSLCGKAGHYSSRCPNPSMAAVFEYISHNRQAMVYTIACAPRISDEVARELKNPHESHIVNFTAETLTRRTPVTGLRDSRVMAAAEANIHTGLTVEEKERREFIREEGNRRLGRMNSDVKHEFALSQNSTGVFTQLSQPQGHPLTN